MDIDELQIKDVYAHYGLTVHLAQLLEFGIINALVALKLPQRHKYSRRDIDEFMEGKFQKTLGFLLKELKSQSSLCPDLRTLLREALDCRNFIVHHYFRQRAEQFATPDGRAEMLLELQHYQNLLERADERLSAAIKPIRRAWGVSDAAIEAEYKRLCKKIGISI